jgi:DnaJ-class molecular chaperone
MPKKEQKKICDSCGGAGQVSFFKGVSRFLLSTKECGACAGTGFQLDAAPKKEKIAAEGNKKKRGAKKKR